MTSGDRTGDEPAPPVAPTGDGPVMARGDVEVLEHQAVYEGYFRLDRYRLRHRVYGGGWTGTMTREVFERGHAVAVIPYDPVRDQLVLIEQFRVGAFAAAQSDWFSDDFSPWLLETVAGIIEQGETPEDVARRETTEETGCPVLELLDVCHILTSPGGSTESAQIYCARVDADEAGDFRGVAHEHEDIRVLVVSPAEMFAWLDAGRFINAATVVALQWFRANHDRVRTLWRDRPARPESTRGK